MCLLVFLKEQKKLKTIISLEEKYDRRRDKDKEYQKNKRRNEEGLTQKQQELKVLKDKIKILKNEGLTNKLISEKLSITLKTLERHITKMKKEGLL